MDDKCTCFENGCGVGTLGTSLQMWCREVCWQQLYEMIEQNDGLEGGVGWWLAAWCNKKMKEIKGTHVHMSGLSKISNIWHWNCWHERNIAMRKPTSTEFPRQWPKYYLIFIGYYFHHRPKKRKEKKGNVLGLSNVLMT